MKIQTTSRHIRFGLLLIMASAQTLHVLPAQTLSQSILSNWTTEKSIGALGVGALVMAGGYYAWQQWKNSHAYFQRNYVRLNENGVEKYMLNITKHTDLEKIMHLYHDPLSADRTDALAVDFGTDPATLKQIFNFRLLHDGKQQNSYSYLSYLKILCHIHFHKLADTNNYTNTSMAESQDQRRLQSIITTTLIMPKMKNIAYFADKLSRSTSYTLYNTLEIDDTDPTSDKITLKSDFYALP